MTASIILLISFAATGALLAGLWAFRRRPAMSKRAVKEGSKSANPADQWGVRIAALPKTRVCPQAQQLLGKAFPIAHKPQLPLPDCPYPQQCECHYIRLFEHRHHERRSGEDHRKVIRFEDGNPPRRSGVDRRRNPGTL